MTPRRFTSFLNIQYPLSTPSRSYTTKKAKKKRADDFRAKQKINTRRLLGRREGIPLLVLLLSSRERYDAPECRVQKRARASVCKLSPCVVYKRSSGLRALEEPWQQINAANREAVPSQLSSFVACAYSFRETPSHWDMRAQKKSN